MSLQEKVDGQFRKLKHNNKQLSDVLKIQEGCQVTASRLMIHHAILAKAMRFCKSSTQTVTKSEWEYTRAWVFLLDVGLC